MIKAFYPRSKGIIERRTS